MEKSRQLWEAVVSKKNLLALLTLKRSTVFKDAK